MNINHVKFAFKLSTIQPFVQHSDVFTRCSPLNSTLGLHIVQHVGKVRCGKRHVHPTDTVFYTVSVTLRSPRHTNHQSTTRAVTAADYQHYFETKLQNNFCTVLCRLNVRTSLRLVRWVEQTVQHEHPHLHPSQLQLLTAEQPHSAPQNTDAWDRPCGRVNA